MGLKENGAKSKIMVLVEKVGRNLINSVDGVWGW